MGRPVSLLTTRAALPGADGDALGERGAVVEVGAAVPASSVLSVMVVGQRHALGIGEEDGRVRPDSEATVLPLYLDPMTKLYLVVLMWCRPWLLDPAATEPLPRTPEIARAALEVTGAYHELERFDTDQAYRDRLSARVAEHIKVLRRKITERGLMRADVRLSDEVVVPECPRRARPPRGPAVGAPSGGWGVPGRGLPAALAAPQSAAVVPRRGRELLPPP
jgi:hypothetical protein